MSRAEEINRLVNDITSRPLVSDTTSMDGLSVRKEIHVALIVNKFLALCRLWNKYKEKKSELENIDVSPHITWATHELKGYRGVDMKTMDKKVMELCRLRKHGEVYVRYSATELELALNNHKTLPLDSKSEAKLKPEDILPIIHALYAEIVDKATDIGKEIDIKHDTGMMGAYDDLGDDYTEVEADDVMDDVARTFGGE